MANALYDEYRERGLVIIHVVIDDGPDADTTVSWRDAYDWAYTQDFGNGYVAPLKVVVLADTDGGLINRFMQPCTLGVECQDSCWVTPQYQILDQAGVTVDDYCFSADDAGPCIQCGWNETHARAVLDSILPAKWCGEATP